jgi:hypothetical protein
MKKKAATNKAAEMPAETCLAETCLNSLNGVKRVIHNWGSTPASAVFGYIYSDIFTGEKVCAVVNDIQETEAGVYKCVAAEYRFKDGSRINFEFSTEPRNYGFTATVTKGDRSE